ncbi:swr complex subunit [Coemansia guatemalensis]|uniref:SWR1-complex protein 4 n=1 Tax=Coemansia guatemalensis TaxID=2761395 RepID=A0A9W8I167_9FUNG|nr:swr complex subunit [Coemansia guatemalensis]
MAQKPRQKAPGMSRELTSLYLENQSIPVVLEQFQAKPKFGTKAERWVWRAFKSSARDDGLALHHWAKANEEYTDYYYARFNAKTNPYQYTDEEYEKCIEPLDKGWSRTETDYLLHMCRQFDLRFIIIHDRYYSHTDCPNSGIESNRTLEDLKDRYYAIGRALTQYRAGEDSRDPEDVPLQTTNKLADDLALLRFDKDKELERKKYLEALFRRTKEEIEEEELLTAEARRIEANERRLVHEREVLLQSHAMFEEATGSAVGPPIKVQYAQTVDPSLASPATTPTAEATPKGRKGAAADGPGDPASARTIKRQKSTHGTPAPLRVRAGSVASRAQGSPGVKVRSPSVSDMVRKSASPSRSIAPSIKSEQGNLSPVFGDPTFGTEIHTVKPAVVEVETAEVGTIVVPQRDARLGPGVFLRSDKLHPIPKNKLDAVKQFMSQLALNSPNTIWPRPVMATPAVCDRFDSLQSIIIPLLDFKKTADKLETEVQVLRARKRMLVNDIGEDKAEEILNRLPPVSTSTAGARHQRKGSSASSRRKSRDSIS